MCIISVYSYLITVSERYISERIVRVNLDLDDAIEDWLILDVENVSLFFLFVSHREA